MHPNASRIFFLISLSIFILVGIPAAQTAGGGNCLAPDPSCAASCNSEYGAGSTLRITYASEIQSCPGGANAYDALQSCYRPLQDEVNACVQPCGTNDACIDHCISERDRKEKLCVDNFADVCLSYCSSHCQTVNTCAPSNNSNGSNTSNNSSVLVVPNGTNQSIVVRPNTTNQTIVDIVRNNTNASNDSLIPRLPNGSTTVMRKKNCSVRVISEFDGVSADGVSEITFTLEVEGDAESASIDIIPVDGPLRGKITRPSPNTITFKPDEADAARNYLKNQRARVIGQCTPNGAPFINFAIRDFTVEQPPLFFVHGLHSDAQSSFGEFEKRASDEGWQYSDIDYGGKQDNAISANQLAKALRTFMQRIREGDYYGHRRISATKTDIIAHSMGGLITRYYIGYLYGGNIRKFVMMGTPNHGAWDAKIAQIGWWDEAVQQLKPDSTFLSELNAFQKNPEIDYHTVAGTGWLTDEGFMDAHFEGDGIVPVSSVRLPGVPLYCTYDAHAGSVYWAGMMGATAFANNGGGWTTSQGGTLTTSDAAYGIVHSAILTGHAQSVAPCPGSPMPKEVQTSTSDTYDRTGAPRGRTAGVRGTVMSPVVLHAYDEKGRHIGPNAGGVLENQIGKDARYINASEAGHAGVIVYGDHNISFKMVGTGAGTFGFRLERWNESGTARVFKFENLSTTLGQTHYLDAAAPQPQMRPFDPGPLPCPMVFLLLALLAVLLVRP